MKMILAVLTFLSLNSVYGLEIDEKLTLRFLKVSQSKKTVLINRGAEDGLVVGDHAKFFITGGVIARGVVEKASPSRSIWSLYRVVDPAEISDGKVLNLKISSPVKITADPTKSMKDEPTSEGSDKMGFGNEEGTSESTVDESDQKELEGMGLEEEAAPVKKTTKVKPRKNRENKEATVVDEIPVVGEKNISDNWELWGTLYVNSLSGTTTSSDTTSGSTATSASTVDFSAGLERYFLTSDNFFKNLSLTVFAHKRSITSGDSIKMTSDWFEYGGGVNYHFLNPASATNRFIGFLGINVGAGTASIKTNTTTSGVQSENIIEGSNTFVSGGVGTKYILTSGFGLRAVIDYYSSSETYNYPNDVTVKRTLAGPRIQLGISYRF